MHEYVFIIIYPVITGDEPGPNFTMPLTKSSPEIFDPNKHENDVYQAFTDWLESWEMWYDVASMGELKEDASVREQELHKAKVFRMCAFQGERLKTDLKAEYNQNIPELKQATFNAMVQKLSTRYKPTQNQVLLHYQFHGLRQEHGEKIDAFINRVRIHADKCAFKCTNRNCTEKDKIHNTLIRDQIIIGTSVQGIREDALEREHELDALITQARKIEATDIAVKKINDPSTSGIAPPAADLNKIQIHESDSADSDPDSQEAYLNKIGKQGGKYSARHQRKKQFQRRPETTSEWRCLGCGDPRCNRGPKCRARGKFCSLCGRKNHFSFVCSNNNNNKDVSTLSIIGTTSVIGINTLQKQKSNFTNITVGKIQLQAMIDTGAEVNVILESKVPTDIERLTPTSIQLQPYGSKPIRPKGTFRADTHWGNKALKATWTVVDDEDLPGKAINLISYNLAESLGIITLHTADTINSIVADTTQTSDFDKLQRSTTPSIANIIAQHPSVFHGLGKMKSKPIQLYVKADASPIIQPPRPIPYHLKDAFKKVISDMETDDVIEPHTGPVTWLSNPVLVPKADGSMRITVDLRNLNRALQDTHLPIPRVEDIMPMFTGKSIFSKLDLKTAFHQLELAEESRPLTVFRAEDRLMRYKRLTMGTLPASGELNHRLRPVIADIPNAAVIQDDIVIAAAGHKEHDQALQLVLTALEEAGLTVSPNKCILGQPEIPFWGFKVNKDGITPDPTKVQSVREAGRPTNKDELRSFLCMIRSNGAFIPDLAAATANLRELTKHSNIFEWTETHQKEFENIKNAFSTDVLLRHYDTKKNTFIFVDAHFTGLCAILAQGQSPDESKAVALASRTTTTAEKNYSQLDLEATAVDFGLRRFRHILIGGPQVVVITDQQPLESLWKSKKKPSARIERILLRHQDINHCVIWRKGKDNPADFISRHAIPLHKLPQRIAEETAEHQKLLFLLHGQFLSSTAITRERLHEAQLSDNISSRLRHFIALNQAPNNDPTLRRYLKLFSELSIIDDIIYKGDQILLPECLHEEAISLAHEGSHPGQDAVKRRLRAHFWFPGMDNTIQHQIGNCHECQIRTASPFKAPLTPTPIPEKPWQAISIDLFGPLPDQRHILVARCNLSRFPDAKIVRSSGAQHILPALGEIYKNFGYPEHHKCDNGPPFNGQEFLDWSTKRGIKVKKSYPYHPQGNEAECFMKPLKKAIQIALDNGRPVQEAIDELLCDYRSTPHPATGLAPGDMLLRGGYRSKFPRRPNPTEHQIQEAKNRDSKKKYTTDAKINSSRWRKYTNIIQGEKVLIKRQIGRNKYSSMFERIPYTVTDIRGSRYELVKDTDYDNSQPIYRHLNDIKKYRSCPTPKIHPTPPLRTLPQRRHRSFGRIDTTPQTPAVPNQPNNSTTLMPRPPNQNNTGGEERSRRYSQRTSKLPQKYDDYIVSLPRDK